MTDNQLAIVAIVLLLAGMLIDGWDRERTLEMYAQDAGADVVSTVASR